MLEKIIICTIPLLFAAVAPAAELRGILLKADSAKGEFTVESKSRTARGQNVTFRVDKDTHYKIGRRDAKLADMPIGKRVHVIFEEVPGQLPLALLVTTLAPVAAAGGVGATPAGTGRAPIPAATASGGEVNGTLRRVALTDRELVIINAGPGGREEETTIFVPEQAPVRRGGSAIRFVDLREGETVQVQTEKHGKSFVAKSIQAGVSVPSSPRRANPPVDGERKLERARQVLKTIDSILAKFDSRNQ